MVRLTGSTPNGTGDVFDTRYSQKITRSLPTNGLEDFIFVFEAQIN
jgi:hypothetical protein